MTRQLTLLFALSPVLLSAQILWEQSYPGQSLSRMRLDASGETYLLAQNCQLKLFHADHSFWKTITLTPTNGDLCANYLLSEKWVDADPGIEVIYHWTSDDIACPPSGIKLQDDDGKDTWINTQYPGPQFSMPPSLVPKLLAGSTVYALPGAVVEHEYGTDNRVYRLPWLDQYMVYDWTLDTFQGFRFYNSAHQLVKTVNLPIAHFQDLSGVTQHYYNDDDLLEFAGVRWFTNDSPNRYRLEIIREDGQQLLSYPCLYANLNQLENQPDLFLVWQTNAEGKNDIQVLDPKNFQVLHIFSDKYVNRFSPDGKTAYFWTKASDTDSLIRIYDDQFNLRRTFTMPVAYRHYWNLRFTQSRFSNSGLLEMYFSTQRDKVNYVVCLDETGQLLYEFSGTTGAKLDRQAGMEDRFWVTYPTKTEVYRFANPSTAAPAPVKPEEYRVYPNPFDSELLVELPSDAGAVQLFDTRGALLQQVNAAPGALARIPGADLPTGVYWLRWTAAGTAHFAKVVKGQ